jgi:hypothetical protein
MGVGFSLALHGAILVAILIGMRGGPREAPPAPVSVELVADPRPPVVPPTPAPEPPAPVLAVDAPAPVRPPPRGVASLIRARRIAAMEVADAPPAAGSEDGVSAGELAGAAVAGAGGASGGACDMARRIQAALRRDPMVRTAIAAAPGRAIRVWNGDWVQSSGEDGRGLSAVREAILWEVGFAPPACRAEAVRGLILFSPSAAPGSARLVLGVGVWRWSDLLRTPASP